MTREQAQEILDTRAGQYLCFKAEALHAYNGDYGLAKEHDTKYNK